MLFNSAYFIFLFLPLTIAGFYALAATGRHRYLSLWLLGAAVVFYASSVARHLPLLVISVLFNYAVSLRIRAATQPGKARAWLTLGITVDLGALAFFKYAPLLSGVSVGGDHAAPVADLPVGISFYTFTQIAYLVDLYRRTADRHRLVDYATFVGYFPHLVAGPVLHHTDVLPQIESRTFGRFDGRMFLTGLVLFGFGLAKKVLLADNIAPIADGAFAGASQGVSLSIAEAWLGVTAYALQIYFDFSGYSDMARGISRLLGIELPINFDSPYRARSIIEFWRRWHMTLSRFLRNYLYIPLGGSRHGLARTIFSLMATMTLGGLWHGAGFGFLVWGAFHGVLLSINHLWRVARQGRKPLPDAVTWPLTLVAVLTGWVFFRAGSLDSAGVMLAGMFGAHGVDLPASASALAGWLPQGFRFEGTFLHGVIELPGTAVMQVVAMGVLALQAFNTNRLVAQLDQRDGALLKSDYVLLAAGALALALSLATLGRDSPFLYYQF